MNLVVNIFDDIVDSMRAIGTITALANDGTTTTVTSDNTLVVGEVVTINGTDYVIKSPTTINFQITGVITSATIWAAKAPYYLFGHPIEISNILLEKNKNDTLKYQKYPLVILFTDIKIGRGDSVIYGELINQAISIIGKSQKSYSTMQRYDNNIESILYPLYNTLMNKIKTSNNFIGTNPNISHNLIERPFWGNNQKYGNVGNMFTDPLDALEISNMNLKLRRIKTNC